MPFETGANSGFRSPVHFPRWVPCLGLVGDVEVAKVWKGRTLRELKDKMVGAQLTKYNASGFHA